MVLTIMDYHIFCYVWRSEGGAFKFSQKQYLANMILSTLPPALTSLPKLIYHTSLAFAE